MIETSQYLMLGLFTSIRYIPNEKYLTINSFPDENMRKICRQYDDGNWLKETRHMIIADKTGGDYRCFKHKLFSDMDYIMKNFDFNSDNASYEVVDKTMQRISLINIEMTKSWKERNTTFLPGYDFTKFSPRCKKLFDGWWNSDISNPVTDFEGSSLTRQMEERWINMYETRFTYKNSDVRFIRSDQPWPDRPMPLLDEARREGKRKFEEGDTTSRPRSRSPILDEVERIKKQRMEEGNTTSNPQIESSSQGELRRFSSQSALDQFEIKDFLSLDLSIFHNLHFSLSNLAVYLTISVFTIYLFNFLLKYFNRFITSGSSISKESIYFTVYNIVINQINAVKGQAYFPLICVLFLFILINNLIGMVPYSFASTSHFILTFYTSFVIVIGATILGLQRYGVKFFSFFVPAGCPLALLPLLVLIEFISYLARNISLGLRLAANVLSGHMLLNILSGFAYNITTSGILYFFVGLIPLAFIISFSGLELGISFIQAQVFIVLTCSYIKDALDLH